MVTKSETTAAEIIAAFRGVYARIARRLDVDASMVSMVANGKRQSVEIQQALRQELMALKSKLDTFVRS